MTDESNRSAGNNSQTQSVSIPITRLNDDERNGDQSHGNPSSNTQQWLANMKFMRSENTKGFTVAFMYGVISVSITFFNKAVLSHYEFKFSNALTLGQMVFSLLFLIIMKRYNIIKFADFSWQLARSLLSLAFYFSLMVVSGLAALALVNVPVFSALRRLSTLIVILGERFMLNKTTPLDEMNSVFAMVGGAVIAGWGDLNFDLVGYTLIAFNCAVTALYLVYISKKSKETGLNTFGLMFYCNLLSMPAIAALVVILELDGIMAFEHYWSFGFQMCFLMSSIQAFLLNYFIFLCSTVNSPLTTSITGQLKAILSTLLGLFMFGDVEITFLLSLGLVVSSVGSIWYSYIKYVQTVARSNAAAAAR